MTDATVRAATAPRDTSIAWPAGGNARLSADVAAFMLALALPTLLALGLDDRTLAGTGVWVKPLKFEVSLALHFATLGLALGLLTPEVRDGRFLRGWIGAAAAAGVFEIAYIALQAARGRASHFNDETAIEQAMYGLMGIGAVALVAAAFVVALAVRRHSRPDVGPGLRLGTVLGLGIGSVATLVIAGLMSSGAVDGPGHWVGGVRSDAGGLPLLGWSTAGGDLRAPHFFATHAMQILPLAGLAADRLVPADAEKTVVLATVAWTALILATFAQALAGLPFLPLG